MRRYTKAVAAFLGALTPGAVVGLLALFGVELDAGVVAGVLTAASTLMAAVVTVLAPPNQPASPSIPDLPPR